MKRLIRRNDESEFIFCMSKLSSKYADEDITGVIHGYIYFSESNDSHGPRIKFYGGTKESASTKDAPSMKFGINTDPELVLHHWMNKKNTPYAYDDKIINDVREFIVQHRPLLLLVWFKHLDEADLLQYFYGRITWSELLGDIDTDNDVSDIVTMSQLDQFCKENNLYQF